MQPVYVDIDGTLAYMDEEFYDWRHIGPPIQHSIEYLRQKKALGYRIVIWSCRTNPEINPPDTPFEGPFQVIREWLDSHGIPYDEIERRPKPVFHELFDDRSVNPWSLPAA